MMVWEILQAKQAVRPAENTTASSNARVAATEVC